MNRSEQEIATMMMQINGLSPLTLKKSIGKAHTGFTILPTSVEGHQYRLLQGIELWNKKHWEAIAEYLLIAGTDERPEEQHIARVRRKTSVQVFSQQKACHTKDQAEFICVMAHSRNIRHIILCTAAYHLPRVFLTTLKSMLRQREKKFILSSVPVYDPKDPAKDLKGFSETYGNGISGEIKRIRKYQRKGDVATLQEYLRYLKWRLIQ